jgi:hypothetical protein
MAEAARGARLRLGAITMPTEGHIAAVRSHGAGRPVTHAASLEECARAEGISVAAAHMLISRALRKLRSQGLVKTCRELAQELDRNRKAVVE